MNWCRDQEFTSTKIKYTVKNIEKKSILPRAERQQIHANVTENNQDMDKEEITIEEEMNTDSNDPRIAWRKVWWILWIWRIRGGGGGGHMMIQKTIHLITDSIKSNCR